LLVCGKACDPQRIKIDRLRSVSPGKGELHVAQEVLRLLQEDGLASSYTAIGLDPLIDDTRAVAR
jgi:hypothetical protein